MWHFHDLRNVFMPLCVTPCSTVLQNNLIFHVVEADFTHRMRRLFLVCSATAIDIPHSAICSL